jgi:MFS family permease
VADTQRRRLPARAQPLSGGLTGNFWRLWTSSVFANLADGILFVALTLAAVRLGASPADLAGLTIASRLPMLAFGLIAGGLADRLDRRRTMVAVQLLRVGVTATLVALAATGNLSLVALTVAAFVLGIGEAFFDTNAQSIVPMVAPRERLVAANGRLFAAETVMGTFAGPPVGAFLVAVSIPLALGSAAVAFVLAALGLMLLAGTFRPESTVERQHLTSEIADGIRFLGRHRLLLTLTSMVALGQMGSAAIFTMLALYAVAPGPMGLTEPQFGLLFVTFGAGSLVGSSLAGSIVARLGRRRVLLLATLVFGLGILVPALTANPLLVGAGTFTVGIAVMAWNVTNVSLRQALLPPALMGRVHATHRTIAYVAGLVGAALAGAIGEVAGLRAAFAVGAAITLLGLLGGFVVTDRRIAEAEAEAEAAAAATAS